MRYVVFVIITIGILSTSRISGRKTEVLTYEHLEQHYKSLMNYFDLINPEYDHNRITVYKFLETQKSSYIIFIQDDEENHFVVKQEKADSMSKQFRAVSEAVCAYIAYFTAIPSHKVCIIPTNVPFPGKFITKRVATLHTLVPGYTIRSNPKGLYAKLNIKQSTELDIADDQRGFTEQTIYWMSQHPDLVLITALDTFLGNKDRNKANILYDPEGDSFYSIDMALMFDILSDRKLVSLVACENVAAMIENNKIFTVQELYALQHYRTILKKLVKKFPPKVLMEIFNKYYEVSGITDIKAPKSKMISVILNGYIRAIKQSYVHIKKLIYLLSILISNNEKLLFKE
jgi:hypothetical protein